MITSKFLFLFIINNTYLTVCTYHTFFDLFFLLLRKGLWYAVVAGLRAKEKFPQLAHEQSRVLAVQKTRQIYLHLFRTGELGAGMDRERKKHIIRSLCQSNKRKTPYHVTCSLFDV